MKSRIIIILTLTVVFAACSKLDFSTEPRVDITSISPEDVVKGNTITLLADFTDDEGDLDSILVVRKRFEGATTLTTDTSRFSTAAINVPDKTREAEIQVLFSYGELRSGQQFLNTETVDRENAFGLVLIDKEGHRSEYDESGRILLRKFP